MGIVEELNMIYIVSMMSVIDLSLTYYILWYDKKLHPNAHFKELNPLAAWIMRLTNTGPLGLLIGGLTTQAILWTALLLLVDYDPLSAIATANFFAGAIFVAIWSHMYSIKKLHKDNQTQKIIAKVSKK